MSTGVSVGLSPFIAALLLIVFLSRALNEVAENSNGISLFFSLLWASYLFLLGHSETNGPLATAMSALVQMPLMYAYLVAGAKFGRATTTLVESQRVKTPMIVSWTSHS